MYKFTGFGVHIKAKDFHKSVKFYQNLGLKKVFEYGPDKQIKEDYNGMVFDTGFGKIEIADGHPAVKPNVFKQTVASSKISFMINVDSLSKVLIKAKKAGIQLAVDPRHYYWGTLETVIKDPDGVVIVLVAPYSEQEAKKINADEYFAVKPKA